MQNCLELVVHSQIWKQLLFYFFQQFQIYSINISQRHNLIKPNIYQIFENVHIFLPDANFTNSFYFLINLINLLLFKIFLNECESNDGVVRLFEIGVELVVQYFLLEQQPEFLVVCLHFLETESVGAD